VKAIVNPKEANQGKKCISGGNKVASESRSGLKFPDGSSKDCEKRYETFPQFKTTQYQNPSTISQRPHRWYNGSLMGSGGKNPILFGTNGRLRLLHTKITSQETPGSQPRSQLYRFVGDVLSQFFSFAILDPLIEELIGLASIRLPRAFDEAVCVVLAAVEMYLRKYHRTILKEKVIGEISRELSVNINRQKLINARWFLAKAGFWHEHLHEISTATYEILRNLTLEVVTSFPFPLKDSLARFRRKLRQCCVILINHLAETRRRPQALEIYAHVIVSLAAESLLNTPVLTSEPLGDPRLNKRVYRAKRQFFEMFNSPQGNSIYQILSRELIKAGEL
ncbi:MAG: hypothetical protein ACFFB3_21645, partial [Candidatus Hodarchaeota archaeon]